MVFVISDTEIEMSLKTSSRKAAVKPKRRAMAVETSETKPEKRKKEKKAGDRVKVVRDSFTMPQADYDLIANLKEKALGAGLQVKKSELLRAGLLALDKLSVAQLKRAVTGLEKIRTGRPKKN